MFHHLDHLQHIWQELLEFSSEAIEQEQLTVILEPLAVLPRQRQEKPLAAMLT